MAKNFEQAVVVEGRIEPIQADKVLARMRAVGVALKEVRCAACKKLLFKGTMIGEIKCKCGHMNRW